MLTFSPLANRPLAAGDQTSAPPIPKSVFAKQIALAAKQLDKYGEICGYYPDTVDVSGNPTEPWNAADGIPAPFVVKIVWNYPGFRSARPLRRDNVLDASAGDITGFMARQSFTPKVGDVLVRSDNSRWTVSTADLVDPDGIVILWEITFCQ